MPPTMKDLILRLKKRGTDTKDKIIERFRRAYKEINELSKYNYVVVNDDLDEATRKVNSIIIAQKCMVDRIEEVYLNNPEETKSTLKEHEDGKLWIHSGDLGHLIKILI